MNLTRFQYFRLVLGLHHINCHIVLFVRSSSPERKKSHKKTSSHKSHSSNRKGEGKLSKEEQEIKEANELREKLGMAPLRV